jgi:hypothetical protein
VGEDCNKGINNPNGVFSGETLYNWCLEVVKDPNIVQYMLKLKNVASVWPTSACVTFIA